MESLGTSLLLLLLLAGLVLMINRRRRAGLLLVLVSAAMLFLAPHMAYRNFKRSAPGVYTGTSGRSLHIEADDQYRILDAAMNTVEQGRVEYSRTEGPSMHFTGTTPLSWNGSAVVNERDRAERFSKAR